MRFWMRWYGGDGGDARPLTYPTPIEWWHSGTTAEETGPNCTICALVDAPSEEEAWARVREYWPEAVPDFAHVKPDDWRPGDRFPDQRAKATP